MLTVGALGMSGCANIVSGALSAMRASSEQAAEDANQKPQMTQLQLREMQTREYESGTTDKILPVALAVLQDEGYVVGNTDAQLGLLTASKQLHEKDVDDSGTAFLKGFFGMGTISSEEWSTIEANVQVSPFGERVRVRMSARLAAISTTGNTNYEQITEADFYRNFFTNLEKGLFIEREGI